MQNVLYLRETSETKAAMIVNKVSQQTKEQFSYI